MKKSGLATVVLSILLLSGCGGGGSSSSSETNNSSSSKSADIIISNTTSFDIKYVWFKKTSDKDFKINVLTKTLKSGEEVLTSTDICDTNIDARSKTTDGRYSTIAKNTFLPCGETIQLTILQK